MLNSSPNNLLTKAEAEALAKLGFADPGFFCRSFLPHWFPLPMPWFHRGCLAILSRQTDWLLKFGPEQWPGMLSPGGKWIDGKGEWTQAQLEKIIKHFVYKLDPEDPVSSALPLFEVDRDSRGNIGAINLRISNRVLIIAPRGVSKTTLVNASNIRRIVYHDTSFLVYLSETATHAEMQLDNVKRELESNELLLQVFGTQKPERTASEHWSQWLIETTHGVVSVAKGRGGQVRGLNHKAKRPSDIVIDDVEDKDSVKTDDQRLKARKWLKADVEPALPQINATGTIVAMGTIIHADSLLCNLARDPEWITVRFGAIDPDDDMLWEFYMTRTQYEAKRRSYLRIGQGAEFNMEYCSSTKAPEEGAKFPGPFVYKSEPFNFFPARAIALDPAIGEDRRADFAAFGVVGMTEKGMIHVLDVFMQKGMHPRDIVDKFFELHFFYDCNRWGIEAIGFQRALIHLMKEEMFRRGKTHGPKAYFEIEPIQHGKKNKIIRVEGVLSTRYKAGYVTHQRRFPLYENQLLDWPNDHKDGPDAVAMAVTLLDPFAAFAYDPENDDPHKLEKDVHPPLDEVMGGDWRSAQ